MAHAWKACWCNSLTSSNLVSSARIGTPETVEIIRFPGFCFGSFRLPVPSVSTPLAPTCRACHISEPTIPKTPSSLRPPCVRHRSPTASHVSRQWADSSPFMFSAQFFRFGSQQSQPPYRKRIAANTGRPSAKVPPETPSDERHTNAYGCHESPFEPSINSLMHRQEAKERSWRTGAGVATSLSDRPRRTSTPSSKRDIEVPAPLAGKIREHLATYVDKKPTALLFTGVRTRGTIGDYD